MLNYCRDAHCAFQNERLVCSLAEKICAAAVDAATYAIDKLYSYRVPDELREQVQIGTRVLVPFGFGNKRAEGVVLAFREDTGEHRLKPIVEALDEQPVLTQEQLKLAAWMRERLYCTYFDCVRAMLPAGLWFRRNEMYTLAPDADPAALHAREGEEGEVLRLFDTAGQTLSLVEIRERLGKGAGRTLDALAGEGILVYHSNTVQKTGDKTEKMLALDMESDEAMSRVRRSAARQDVVSALADGIWMSQKELSYMTGASDAALRDMVKKGILRVRYEERMRAPDFSDVPRAAKPVLSAQQQEAYDGMAALMDEPKAQAALLFGVTGSGKTQVYLRLIAHALETGKSAIVLVPEIGLTPQETERLFKILRRMREQGCAIIIITHKLNEVLSISDRVTILRKGKSIETVETAGCDEKKLTELMVGRPISLNIERPEMEKRETILKIVDLTVDKSDGGVALDDISFEIKTGEILGVAGVAGSGQKELCETLTGLMDAKKGAILYRKENIIGKTPAEIIRLGISMSFVPEDRLGMGLVASMGMVDNMLLKSYSEGKGLFVDRKPAREMAERLIGELGIVTPGVDTPVRMMSGGNVQKVLLGREIESSPQVLITAYPVRGLDINSSYLIYDLLNQQKKKGVAVVYIGEDLDVLLELSDRIMVLCHGKITGIVDAKKLTKEQLGLMMTGTEAGELGLDKSMASEKKEEQA